MLRQRRRGRLAVSVAAAPAPAARNTLQPNEAWELVQDGLRPHLLGRQLRVRRRFVAQRQVVRNNEVAGPPLQGVRRNKSTGN